MLTAFNNRIKLWGRIGATIYLDREIAKKDGLEEAFRKAFTNNTVFAEGESYLVGDLVEEFANREDITKEMLGVEEDGYIDELDCPSFVVPHDRDFYEKNYYVVYARIGCTIYVEESTVKEKGLKKALLEAFENDQVIADGESYVPEEWNYQEGVTDEILKPFEDEWEIDSYMPEGWKFK